MSFPVKISFNDDIRRVSLERNITFEELLRTARNTFKFSAASDLIIKYEDDEKDIVTVSSDMELREAVALAGKSGKVLRLFVSEKAKSAPKDEGVQAAGNLVQFIEPNTILADITLPAEKLDEVLALLRGSNINKKEEPNVNNNNNASSSNAPATHEGVTCDGCGQTPIVGARFKCTVCHDYDLCEKCEAKGTHDSAHPLVKMLKPRTCPYGRRFGGWRHQQQGADGQATHFGVACDGCHQTPIVGQRFKCTVCPNYDLCESCNAKGVHKEHTLENTPVRPFWGHRRGGGWRCGAGWRRADQNQEPAAQPVPEPAAPVAPIIDQPVAQDPVVPLVPHALMVPADRNPGCVVSDIFLPFAAPAPAPVPEVPVVPVVPEPVVPAPVIPAPVVPAPAVPAPVVPEMTEVEEDAVASLQAMGFNNSLEALRRNRGDIIATINYLLAQ